MLSAQTAVVTGAGGGIGYETARALLWLGASVVIAEVNARAGKDAAARLSGEFDPARVLFVHTDVGSERSVRRMAAQALRRFAKVDILIQNATITPLGAVQDVPIASWDRSYGVNLRGPVLLTQAFLPGMLNRNYGVLMSVSSYGPAYMGAYEIFKKAQTELANTLHAELEGTGVIAFTMGPGFVPTDTAREGIESVARMYGKDPAVFYDMVRPQTLTVEAAGAGFAAAAALAEQFRGQEIASILALHAAGIDISSGETAAVYTPEQLRDIHAALTPVIKTLDEHAASWADFNLFQRQWLVRTFQKDAGMSTGQWLQALRQLEDAASAEDLEAASRVHLPLEGLLRYYQGLYDRAQGFIKDPTQRAEQLGIVQGWQDEVRRLRDAVQSQA